MAAIITPNPIESMALEERWDREFSDPFTGTLNPDLWQVSRISQAFYQSYKNAWIQTIDGAKPPHDIRVESEEGCLMTSMCSGAFSDFYVYNSAMCLQPVGVTPTGITSVEWEVDFLSKGEHDRWVEVWFTRDPIPAPHSLNAGTACYPVDGFGFVFNIGSPGRTTNSLRKIMLFKSGVLFAYGPVSKPGLGSVVLKTVKGMRNKFRLDIDPAGRSLRIFGSDAGSPALKMIYNMSGLPVGFCPEQLFIHLQQAHYGPEKLPGTVMDADWSYDWGPVCFGGPALPALVCSRIDLTTPCTGPALMPGREMVNLAVAVDKSGRDFHFSDPPGTDKIFTFNLLQNTLKGFGVAVNGFRYNIPAPERASVWKAYSIPISSPGNTLINISSAASTLISNASIFTNAGVADVISASIF